VAQLEADWVAIHELSHLWLPRLHAEDRWLSEGIATYLQEVLRARCGLQSSDRAWTRIREGFERGRRSGSGRTLADESRSMNRTGAYQRVYWAGTAFALETDLRLRRRSNGESTLLTVLDDAQRNWADETRAVSASRVLAALEQSSGAGFITALGERYAASSGFPDTSYVDSSDYEDLRTQVSAPVDGGCTVSGESSR
jgi:predicted metalloprotease with PDZ domain